MSKFHSMVSRRDFMKGLGLAGAGLGAAAAAAPVFHDLDELISSPQANQKRPWYVKERELMNPTTEIDWNIMKRWDFRFHAQDEHMRAFYYGTERALATAAKAAAATDQRLKSNAPGWGHKWVALRNAISVQNKWTPTFSGPAGTGVTLAKTPEQLGVPKWTGTPEEASKILVAATRLFGAGMLGFAELDSTWRNKLVATHSDRYKDRAKYADLSVPYPPPDSESCYFVFEDVDRGYETGEYGKKVIPTKPMWVIVIGGPEPRQNDRTGLSTLGKSNLIANAYLRGHAYFSTWNFLRGLGYQSLGDHGHGKDPFVWGAVSVLTGLAESSRQNNWVLTPEDGPRMMVQTQITDLPVAPTNPIDAGMWRFCHSCTKCADSCPVQSISFDEEPSWEITPATLEGKPNIVHNPGPKHFWWNAPACALFFRETGHSCSICSGVCSFSVGNEAMIHDVLRGTIATTGIFNGFFYNMSKTFGYGLMDDPEEWWDMSLPIFGIDTTNVSYSGGYRK